MMDTVITIGLLLKVGAIGAGIVLLVLGTLMVFAAGMASSPTREAQQYERRGCAVFLIGLAILIGGAVWIFA